MLARKRLPMLIPVLLTGCFSVDRNYVQERLNDGTFQASDSAIADVRGLKPQLQFPCRVAVYIKPGEHDWRWTPDDKTNLMLWADELKRERIASDVFTLPELMVNAEGKTDVRALRIAAARCGADVLFVIHGAAQTESHKNLGAVLDLTILGGFVVPASHRDSLFMIEGVLLDVDNGYIYTAVQSEGEGKIIRPTFLIEDRDAVEKAKARAIGQFRDEVLAHMRSLTAARPSPRLFNYTSIQTDDPKPKIVPSTPSSPRVVTDVITVNGVAIPKP